MEPPGLSNITETSNELITCLQDDLYVSDVGLVDGLIEEGYLSADDWEAIHRVFRNKKKVKILIKSLAKCSDPFNAFKSLLNKLERSHKHLIPSVQRILEALVNNHRFPVEHDDTCVSANRYDINDEGSVHTYRREPTENSFHEAFSHDNVNCIKGDIAQGRRVWDSVSMKYPVSETCTGSNGQEACEHSWNPDTNNNVQTHQCQVIRNSKQLDNLPLTHIRQDVTSQTCSAKRNGNSVNGSGVIPLYTDAHNRSATENSFYGLDEVDSAGLDIEYNDPVELERDQSRCDEEMCFSERLGLTTKISKLGLHDKSEIQCCRKLTETNTDLKCTMIYGNSNTIHKQKTVYNNAVRTSSCDDCCSERSEKNVFEPYDDGEGLVARGTHTARSEAKHGVCRKCLELREIKRHRNGMAYQNCHHGNIRNGRKRYSFEVVLSSSSSSESEINTEVSTSDLDENERMIFDNIVSDGISDAVDGYIESGMLSPDDYNLIHGTFSTRKKKALLTRILSEERQHVPQTLNKTSAQHITLTNVRGCDVVDAAVEMCDKTANQHALSIALNILPESGQVVIKNLDVVFDKFNKMLNDGALKVDELPDDCNIQCIVHYLHACDNLYRYDFDTAKTHIKKADVLLPCTDYPEQLRCEIFTAKTWLSLQTKKLGKMLRLLEENEQSMRSFPDHWPNKAKGWFYYDYCRCYEALLKRLLFQGAHVRSGSEKSVQRYKELAIHCAKRAIDYFRISTSSDGPIGTGFAMCQIASLHLLFYMGTPVHEITISSEDLKNAEIAIKGIEGLQDGLPDVLKASYLITKCSYLARSGEVGGAFELAQEALELSQRLDLQLEMSISQFMMEQLGKWPRVSGIVRQSHVTSSVVSSDEEISDMTDSN